MGRRLKEEPLIPFGLGLTVYALFGATRSIRRGNKTQTNMYFRARVYAQAFTLLCLCVGSVYWKEDRDKRKHYSGLLAEKRAQEKKDAWIRELEARDREDSEEREKKERRRALRKAEREKAEAEGVVESNDAVKLNSGLPDADIRSLVGGPRILAPAAMLWRWRHARSEDEDQN